MPTGYSKNHASGIGCHGDQGLPWALVSRTQLPEDTTLVPWAFPDESLRQALPFIKDTTSVGKVKGARPHPMDTYVQCQK